jgi:membrane protein
LAAVGIFAQFERAFDRIWNVKTAPRRGVWHAVRGALWERLRAFLILMGLGLAAVLVFFAGMVLSAMQPWLEGIPLGAAAGGLVQIPVMLALDGVLFTVIYKVLPKAPVRWSAAARGGLLAALLWEITRQAMAIGLRGGGYGAYGVIGSLIVLMLWVYVASCVIFLGAEYVQVVGEEEAEAAPAGSDTRRSD